MITEVERFNDQVEQWAKELMDDVHDELDALGVQHYRRSPNKTPLRKALKAKTYKRDGLIYRIGVSMPLSAIYLHKGVSKGHPKTNRRTEKKWFNPVVVRNLDRLENIVADQQASFVINNITIK